MEGRKEGRKRQQCSLQSRSSPEAAGGGRLEAVGGGAGHEGRPAGQSMIYGQREIKHTRAAAVAAAHAAVRRGHISPTFELNRAKKGEGGCPLHNVQPDGPPPISRRDPPNRSPPFVCLSVGHKGGRAAAAAARESHFFLPFLPFLALFESANECWIGSGRWSGRAREREREPFNWEHERRSWKCRSDVQYWVPKKEERELQRVANERRFTLPLWLSFKRERDQSCLGLLVEGGRSSCTKNIPQRHNFEWMALPPFPSLSPLARTEQEMRDGMRKEVRGRHGRPLLRFMVPSCTTAVLIHLQCMPVADITLGEAKEHFPQSLRSFFHEGLFPHIRLALQI